MHLVLVGERKGREGKGGEGKNTIRLIRKYTIIPIRIFIEK